MIFLSLYIYFVRMLSKKLINLINKNIDLISTSREIPSELQDELLNEKLFRLLLPKTYGGLEVDFINYLDIIFELASYDASIAWCINQSNVLATNSAFMNKSLAKKIFDNPKSMISNGPPENFNITNTNGGIIISGKWLFSSGIKNCNWVLAIFTDDNKENKNIIIPVEEVKVEDIWNVNGLRGTGSFSFSLKDKFIPDENIFFDRKNLNEKGPLYKIPRDLKFASGFSTIAISLANSAIQYSIDFSKNKKKSMDTLSKEQIFIREIGMTKALYKSSKYFLDIAVDKVWKNCCKGNVLMDDELAELRLASTHAIRTSEEIIKKLYSLLGSSSIFKFNDIQRHFQDIMAISQQIQGRMSHYETVGDYYINSKLKKII